jgi:hypothetical protein
MSPSPVTQGDYLVALKRSRAITTGGVKLDALAPSIHVRGNSLTAPVKVAATASGQAAPLKSSKVQPKRSGPT